MLKESSPIQGFITFKQYRKLLDALPDYLQPVLTFTYQTGWRRNEITNLQWKNVSMKERTITLDPGATKNEKGRTIYMDEIVFEILRGQFKNHMRYPKCQWVFHRSGKQIRDIRKS